MNGVNPNVHPARAVDRVHNIAEEVVKGRLFVRVQRASVWVVLVRHPVFHDHGACGSGGDEGGGGGRRRKDAKWD